ncbi:hypothetical protein [Kluyvera sp. CHPC 1.2972]|uniref:hypothetical protein n=1 Tax=Kluyvera sp. CHPC 1.2972 TaxID=2995176 RepID=UPI002FD85255
MTTNNQLTNKRTVGARIAALLVADSVPLTDAWKALIDDAELQEHRKAADSAKQDCAAAIEALSPRAGGQ